MVGNREFPKRGRGELGWNCLVSDSEYFNFLHFERLRTREKHLPLKSGVVGVTGVKVAEFGPRSE
jgi:hypothetical protein